MIDLADLAHRSTEALKSSEACTCSNALREFVRTQFPVMAAEIQDLRRKLRKIEEAPTQEFTPHTEPQFKHG